MTDYQFYTNWKFDATVEQVWQVLRQIDEWPTWWPCVSKVEVVKYGDENEIGAVRRITWKTALPYTFTFNLELLSMDKYRRMEGRAFGELVGKGIWYFSHENGLTNVVYDWRVNTNKAWMNLIAPIARPIFSWNHDKVMEAGFEGLKKRLANI